MISPIEPYSKVTFPTNEAAYQASIALSDFVQADPANLTLMVGHATTRVVMWKHVVDFDNRTLYLSPGALAVMRRLVPSLPEPEEIAPTQLPESKATLLGDTTDWDQGQPRMS